MNEINDYLSKADEDIAKNVMYRVYGIPGPLFVDQEQGGDTPEPTPVDDNMIISKYYFDLGFEPTEYSIFSGYFEDLGVEVPFASMEIDGVKYNTVNASDYLYTFETPGWHIVKFKLKDNTTIPENTFNGSNIYEITIPKTIISIDDHAFSNCNDFCMVCLNPEPPEFDSGSVFNNTTTIRLLVPESSVDDYRNSDWNCFRAIFHLKPEGMSNSEIWYKTESGNTIDSNCIGDNTVSDIDENSLTLVSNTYENGYGKLKFSGDIDTIGSGFLSGVTLTEIMLPESVFEVNGVAFESSIGGTIISYGTMFGYPWYELPT